MFRADPESLDRKRCVQFECGQEKVLDPPSWALYFKQQVQILLVVVQILLLVKMLYQLLQLLLIMWLLELML